MRFAAGSRSPARGHVKSAPDMPASEGPQHQVGVTQLQPVDALAHDGEGLQQHLEGVARRPCLRAPARCPPPAPAWPPSGAPKRTGTGEPHQAAVGHTRARRCAPAGTPPAPRWKPAPRCRCRPRGTGWARRCPGRWRRCPAAASSARWRGRRSGRARSLRQRLAADQARGGKGPVGDGASRPCGCASWPARCPCRPDGVERRHQAAGRGAHHQVGLGCRLLPAPGSRRCGQSRVPPRRPAPARCAAAPGGGTSGRRRW